MRAILFVEGGRVRAHSRNDLDVSAAFPELADVGDFLGMTTCVLDGEIVALGEDGRPSFGKLQHRMHVANQREARRRAASDPVTFVAFDILYLRGHSLLAESYEQRRAVLESLRLSGGSFITTESFRGVSGRDVLAAAVQNGLEGVVAKRLGLALPAGSSERGLDQGKSSEPKKSSSEAGPRAAGSVTGAWGRSCWVFRALRGCATSGRWGPDSVRPTARTCSTTSDRWHRPTVRSLPRFHALKPRRHISSALSLLRVSFGEWTTTGRLDTRPGEACDRRKPRTRSSWRVRERLQVGHPDHH